ncbi:MAG: glycosyltransferase [Nanoarchaeota archaeon]|nr:glycosyltransferase [Nanoarchaeota archaeon]
MLWNIFTYVTVYFGLFTGIFFLFTFFENMGGLKERKAKRFPKVTIIVPAYNEETTLKGTVYSLLNLDYPKDKLEIIVVDDGSKDSTYEVAKQFIKKGVKVFTKENGGKATALNFALTKSTGELVGCLDADSFVTSSALKKMVGYFEDPEIMAVTPSIKVWKDNCLLQKMQKVEYLMGVFLRKAFAYLDSIHVTPGPFTIYRKWFFDKYGGYDVGNLTEDIEVALRIQRHGFSIENVMDANVYTISPNKFKSLLRQRNRWYIGFLTNVFNYKDLFGLKHGNLGILVLPSAFISIALSIILFLYTLGNLLNHSFKNLINFYNVGFDITPFFTNSQNFYWDFSPLRILALLSLLTGILMITLTKKYSREESKIGFAYFLYLIAYWIFFAFWWIIAISLKTLKRQVSW